MDRHVEINPGEPFLVADRMLFVYEYESVLADIAKFDGENARTAYMFTFKGKINNSDEMGEVTVAMSPEDAFTLTGHVLDGLELLARQRGK